MSILGFIKETVSRGVKALFTTEDTVVSFTKSAITPEKVVNTVKAVVKSTVIYTVLVKKVIPFVYNLWKGTRKENRPMTNTILASKHDKDAKEAMDKMTDNAAKAVRDDNAGIKVTDVDFYGNATFDDKFQSFSREDRALLYDMKRLSKKEQNSEEALREVFFQNAPNYLDKAMGRTPKVDMPEIKNAYFRDYMDCKKPGRSKRGEYHYNDDYLAIGDTIITPATIADAYLVYIEEVCEWMRSNRKYKNQATMYEYITYDEVLPVVAATGFKMIKAKAKEKPLTMGEFKRALKWIMEESNYLRPDNPLANFIPNRA